MKDYADIANTVGAFPDVVSKNVTSPGAMDGTPFIKDLIDDLWGFSQALMDAAGLTPTGVVESASVSQRLEAIQKIVGHPGEVVPWMGDMYTDPATLGIRLLLLTGQGILRANYPDLDDAVYVGDTYNPTAPSFYRSTDVGGTIRDVAGAYLQMPDLRGYALRGLDLAAGVDPDGFTRKVGDVQEDDFIKHTHQTIRMNTSPYDELSAATWFATPGTGSDYFFAYRVTTGNGIFEAYKENISPSGHDFETRMTNSATRWCIRY